MPESVLETEAAVHVGLLVRRAGYELGVSPRRNGADLAAGRQGTMWVTFHIDVDQRRPLFLQVGATVWGGARTAFPHDVPWDGDVPPILTEFVHGRLSLACKRGRDQNPDHCAECPDASHRAA